MPNRGPLALSQSERDGLAALLQIELAEDEDEDEDERRLIQMRAAVGGHLREIAFADARSSILLTTEEADMCLDLLGPPDASSSLDDLRSRIADLHRQLLAEDRAGACGCKHRH